MAGTKKPYIWIGIFAAGATLLLMQGGERRERVEMDLLQQEQLLEAKGMLDSLSRLPLRSVSGNYLAARFAVSNDDLGRAAGFYDRAMKSAKPGEAENLLFDRGLPVAIGAGKITEALAISQKLDWKRQNATGQLAVLVQLIDGFKQQDVPVIGEKLPFLRDDGFGRLLKPLLQTWYFVSQEKYAAAITSLEELTRSYPSLRPLVQMHLAFVYQIQGNLSEATHYYAQAQKDHLSIRSAYLIGQFYESLGEKDKALALYTELESLMPGSPLPKLVQARLKDGKLNKKSAINKPSDGVSAALYDVATVLYQENSPRLAILYAQLSHYLTPEDDFTNLLLGDILASTRTLDQAEAFFKKVPERSDMYVLAQMRLAQIYEQKKELPKAIAILEHFAKNPLITRQADMELGDLYRRQEDYAAAIPYYTRMIDALKAPTESDWVVYFARGICYERDDQWEKAEADLLKALDLSPQQPEVLNYLAYSWADHGKNLSKALAMLEAALEGAPDDPYIADSVGWALHKNGRTEEGIPYIEASLEYMPDDTVVNDHLGDLYWTVGRRLEARFQWERALKNAKETDAKMIESLRRKLKHGLSAEEIPVQVRVEPVEDIPQEKEL